MSQQQGSLACVSVRMLLCVNPRLPKNGGRNAMEVLMALAIYFVVWALVIWGAMYFNKNVV